MAHSLLKKEAVPFAMVPNELLNDKRVSLKAKGLFAYLSSQEVSVGFSIKSIACDCLEGIDSVRAGLKELENFGYLEMQKFQTSKGFVSSYSLIFNPEIKVVIN